MCSITGSYPLTAPEAVQCMVEKSKHRGPDGDGLVETQAGNLGHTRLAILDVANGQQPMHHQQHWITFNGEIYNHRELRRRYIKEGTLRTSTDTEVILHLYTWLGPDCVELLDGMFALAIVSPEGLFLARDPLGIKPLYFGSRGDTLYFASEIKALAQVTNDIQVFPPGHWYHSKLGWQNYYRLEDTIQTLESLAANQNEALPLIRYTLRQAVHKRLMSDVPLGISLSGGLDSSIVSLLACEGLDRLHSFAVGVEGSADLAAARGVARFLGTRHHEFIYTAQAIEAVLPEVIYYLESFDPALVRSAIPNYFLARLAAEQVKVFLTGEGADELYAGYAYLAVFDQPEALQAELIGITNALHHTNLQRADRMSMAHGLEARVPFLDVKSVALALGLPATWKLHSPGRPEKALLRLAFAESLPVVVPSSAHANIAKMAAPYLRDDQIIILHPGRTCGAIEFVKVLKDNACRAEVTVAEAETLIYASRSEGPAQARIFSIKESVPVAALPATRTYQVLEILAPAYPQFIDGVSVLHTGLNNMGAIFHPALTLLNAGRIESTGGEFQFYIEGVTPSVARVLEVLDRERVTVAAALGIRAQTAQEWLKMAYSAAGATLFEAVHNQLGYHGITAPGTLNHRYIFEDVPMSLVPIASLGQRHGVSVRGMDSIIRLACIIHRTDYWRRGRTVENLGLEGLSVSELMGYVIEGEPELWQVPRWGV